MNTLELAQSVGRPVDFIAFERGVVLRPRGELWTTHGASGAGSVEVSVDRIESLHRPVLIRFSPIGTSSTFDRMLQQGPGFAPMVPNFGMTAPLIYDAMAVQYLAGALVHHVAGIVHAYEGVRDAFKDASAIASLDRRAMFGSQPEPYYEFDALLGVIRRSYDACRYLLWKCFGPANGGVPSSLKKVLPFCDRLDPDVKQSLETSWSMWGTLVTEYRDCVHHYVPIDFGISSIMMEETLPGVWGAMARIPDNPEARSKRQFRFTSGLDALTFGWTAACEASRVLRLVATAVERKQAAAV